LKNRMLRSRSVKILLFLLLAVMVFVSAGAWFLASNYNDIGNLVKVIALIRTQYLWPADFNTLVDGAIKGIVESLGDDYSVYLEPETYKQLREQIKGTFGGIGLLVGMDGDNITVVRPFEGTPAERAGIKAGDIIIGVGDKDVTGMDLETAVGLMRGPVGTKIKLVIRREGIEHPLEFVITREEIKVPTVEGRTVDIIKSSAFARVGYVVISQFNEKTPEELNNLLKKLLGEDIRGIILDLRNNPGGELISAVNVADKFVPEGPIVFIDYRSAKDDRYEADSKFLNLPLVVLVNERTASAAEILAGAIKDAGVGTLVGTKTFGKGIVQTIFPLDNGAGLKLTVAKYLTRNKIDIHKQGIIPDVVVKQPEEALQDLQMEKAIEIMREKILG